MRFYTIDIGPSPTGSPAYSFSSLGSTGLPNPGALNIILDIPSYNFASPMGAGSVQIWGIPLVTQKGPPGLPGISQASDLNGALLKVSGGMSDGLPLAKSSQQGPILQGTIFQAFGNWIGVDQTLDLVAYISPDTYDPDTGKPKDVNLTFKWAKGQLMSDAISQTLKTAYKGVTVTPQISSDLVGTSDQAPGNYSDLTSFSQMIKDQSLSIIKTPNYQGVDITYTASGGFLISDGTIQGKIIQLDFPDLIGQPTWFAPNQVQFNTVMRADISCQSTIKFPQLQATSTAAEQSNQAKDKSSFTGPFQINMVRHVGNFRQAGARSWITTFNAYPSG